MAGDSVNVVTNQFWLKAIELTHILLKNAQKGATNSLLKLLFEFSASQVTMFQTNETRIAIPKR